MYSVTFHHGYIYTFDKNEVDQMLMMDYLLHASSKSLQVDFKAVQKSAEKP